MHLENESVTSSPYESPVTGAHGKKNILPHAWKMCAVEQYPLQHQESSGIQEYPFTIPRSIVNPWSWKYGKGECNPLCWQEEGKWSESEEAECHPLLVDLWKVRYQMMARLIPDPQDYRSLETSVWWKHYPGEWKNRKMKDGEPYSSSLSQRVSGRWFDQQSYLPFSCLPVLPSLWSWVPFQVSIRHWRL